MMKDINLMITDQTMCAIFLMHAEEENNMEVIDPSYAPGITMGITLSSLVMPASFPLLFLICVS